MHNLLEALFAEKHRLTARKRALSVLHDLCARRERIDLYPEGSVQPLPSILLEVDEEEELLLFDIPPPVEGAHWDGEQPLRVVSRHEGIQVGFELQEVERAHWNDRPALSAELPLRVYYLQRREYFRVPVGRGDVRSVLLVREGAAQLQGRCQDLSAGGMRVLVPPPQDGYALRPGENLSELRFELKGVELQTAASIRHVDEAVLLPNGQSLLPVGLAFTDKSFAFDQAIVRYVQQRDRDILGGRH